MMNFPRRAFLKTMGSLSILFSVGCDPKKKFNPPDFQPQNITDPEPIEPKVEPGQTVQISSFEMTNPKAFKPGYLTIVQGPTSDTETLINLFVPRLKREKYKYLVVDPTGNKISVEPYERVTGPLFFHIEKLKISGLQPGLRYQLQILDRELIVDQRNFSSLNTQTQNPHFALFSCMCDDYRFNEAIDPMWDRLQKEKPEFLIMMGDMVYIDSKEFVPRDNVTEMDLWQRYTDAFRRIPLYHWVDLIPVFTTWDDHDFGTNNGDRDFKAKEASLRLFHAFFGGPNLGDTWVNGPAGVASQINAFGQRFFLMDDRTFRQPNERQAEKEAYGHWGQEQHEWLMRNLQSDPTPSWIVNGNQFLKGAAMVFNEAFEKDHPIEFSTFMSELANCRAPVVFASGDVHLSEIMEVPLASTGYQTYELTSSCMHSYVGDGWENPLRMPGAMTREFNFMIIDSRRLESGFNLQIRSLGLAKEAYFSKNLVIEREQRI